MDPGTASKTHKKVTAGKYGISKFESKAQVSLQVRLHEDTGEIKVGRKSSGILHLLQERQPFICFPRGFLSPHLRPAF